MSFSPLGILQTHNGPLSSCLDQLNGQSIASSHHKGQGSLPGSRLNFFKVVLSTANIMFTFVSYDCLSTVQNMIPLIISIFFQIIKVDLCYEIGLLRRCQSGQFLKVSAFSLSGKTPNLKVEISKSFAFTISA